MNSPSVMRSIRWLIWVYFALLFLEGALRKWVVPQFSNPLLIVRDPVVILIYLLSLHCRIFPLSMPIVSLFIIGAITLTTGLFAEDTTWTVVLYGFRVNYLHPPLIFLLPYCVDRQFLLKVGRASLWILLPMSILMTYQFLSPPTHWINTTAGGEGLQIRGTVGNIRPPGVFSFVTGIAEYFPLATAFLCYGVLFPGVYRGRLLTLAAAGLVVGCAVCISRLTLTGVIIVLTVASFFSLWQARHAMRMVAYFILGVGLVMILLQFEVIQMGFSTFADRVQAAGGAEGGWQGYIKRIFKVVLDPFTKLDELPVFGEGLGMGTGAGAGLLIGKRSFMLGEGEWSRVIMENGLISGLFFWGWRVWLAIYLGVRSLRCMRLGDGLPIMLYGAAAPLIVIGQWGRPTTLGFSVFISALCYLACLTSDQGRDA